MKKLINEAIANITNSIDYATNNEDYLDRYYQIAPDMFTEYQDRVIEVLTAFIEKETFYNLDKLLEIKPKLLTDLIYTIATNDIYFELTRNYDSYGYLKVYDLFGMQTGEEEIQLFDIDSKRLGALSKHYVEHKTGTVINAGYAYIVLHNSIMVSLNIAEVKELVQDQIAELIEEHNNKETK